MLFALIATAAAQVYVGDGEPLTWEDLDLYEERDPLGVPPSAEDGVVGGEPVPQGEWDDAVAMVFDNTYVGCTGTLIAPDVVMTAEHCTDGITHVIVGTKNWYTDQGEVIEIAQVWNHPSRDIALVRMAASSSVEPRVIAADCIAKDHLKNGAEVALVGFGNTNAQGSESTNKLRQGYSYVEDRNCRNTWGCDFPGDELVQGGNEVNGCFGDSGGPLYLLTSEGDYVAGVASRVLGGQGSPCRNGTIYVRPDAMLTWMERKLGEELPRPVCNLAPEPSAAPIVTAKNTAGTTLVLANDPDASNVHSFAIAAPPAHGEASVDAEGTVTYVPDPGFRGEDAFAVAVTDDGSPYERSGPITSEVDVSVTVGRATGEAPLAGCGCSGAGGLGTGWVGLGLVALVLRRRSYATLSR